jgi:hypothetical protein
VLDAGPAGDASVSDYYDAETALLDALNAYDSWIGIK